MNHAFEIIPLTVSTKGEITTNNLPEVRELIREALGNINRDLKTDEEFGQAELDCKKLKSLEDQVRDAAAKAFDDEINKLVTALNETAEEIRVPRLELEKLIAKRKEDVKAEIVEEFLAAFDIDEDLARKHFLSRLKGEMSGKRTVESMRKACRVYQTTQQAIIVKSREVIARFEKAHGSEMIMDRRELELKSPEGVEAELRRRWEAKKATDEAAKLKAEADEAKAEAAKAQLALAESTKSPAAPMPENVERGPWVGSSNGAGGVAVAPETVATPAVSASDEWKEFKANCLASFKPLKEAREGLKHQTNIARATIFANGINKIWKEEMQ